MIAGTNRIDRKFAELKARRQKALILFITAGDPSLKKDAELVLAFEKEGADLIELGVPFSDPLADGPVIQASSLRSLKKHTNLKKIFKLVRNIRVRSQIPVLLMSYLNPILSYGIERFAVDARKTGVDGLIVPDLPPDEGKEIGAVLKRERIKLIYLLAPTSTAKRRQLVTHASSGFVYYVSITGVTGSGKSISKEIGTNIRSAKKQTALPVCVGFGISTPEQAKKIAAMSDGVILGSTIVSALNAHPHLSPAVFSEKFVRPFARAIKKKGV